MPAHPPDLVDPVGPVDSTAIRRADAAFGGWAALGTGLATLVAFGVALATPPVSGPLCQEGCVRYPYLDVAARFPRDYYWMYPAIVAALGFVAFMVGLAARARPARRLWAHLSITLAAMAALTIAGDYFVQLAVVQPSLLAGETDGIALLTQYNPHGVFIALEELGYLLMSLAMACMAIALPRASRGERAVRWLFVGGLVACGAALAYFLIRYGHQRAYLLEVALISIVWATLIPGTLVMAAIWRRERAAI